MTLENAPRGAAVAHITRATVLRLVFGLILSQATYVIARLGVADIMPSGDPMPVDEIAARVGANADALYRMMRALAAEGLFHEGPERVFALTEAGALLRDDAEGTLRYVAIINSEELYPVWGRALDAVREGVPAGRLVWGESHFERLAKHPDDSKIFNRALEASELGRFATLDNLDWSAVRTVVDVGGGTGRILLRLLAREPHLSGIVFDLPHLGEQARAEIAAAGLQDRCEFVGGSFLEAVPRGSDVYVLAGTMHDWNDADATRILRVCRRAAREDSRLVVVDSIVPDGNDPDLSKVMDLQMLVVLGGRERKEVDFRALLAAGGFRLQQVVEGPGSCALEAVPV